MQSPSEWDAGCPDRANRFEFSSAAAEAAAGREQVMCHKRASCKHCKGTEASLGTSKTPEGDKLESS